MAAKWKLKGYDTFEEGPDAFYPLDGEFDTEEGAKQEAGNRLKELEASQPSSSSGGQAGIQDQIYVIRPDGTSYRFFG